MLRHGSYHNPKSLDEWIELLNSLKEIAYMLDMITLVDAKGIIRYNSPANERILGYTQEESLGKYVLNSVHPDDLQGLTGTFRKTFETAAPGMREYRFKCKDGRYLWLESIGKPLRDSEGKVAGAFFINRDVTSRKHQEQLLQKSYEQVKQLLASISQVIISIDSEGRINQWNTAAENTFGIEEAGVIGKPFVECGIQWDWEKLKELISTRKTGNLLDEIRFTQPDGKEGIWGFNINFTSFEINKESGYILVGSEISERKKHEAQQILSQKLESIGQLAAGIAHEINTPMQFIGDNARFLRDGFNDICKLIEAYSNLIGSIAKDVDANDMAKVKEIEKQIDIDFLTAEIPQAIDQSLDGIARVSKLVLAMKDFSHSGSEEKALSDINKAIKGTITISRNEWKYAADLEMALEQDLPEVNCAIDEINQVILNMIINSAQAIAQAQSNAGNDHGSGKGKIKIKTKSSKDFVQIIIGDTGAGITQANLHRIFDPFFTTKEVGKGTGQGLAMAHDIIVNKHGGSIQVESEAGKGTTFTINLPVGTCEVRGKPISSVLLKV